jgi:hypothetical protein
MDHHQSRIAPDPDASPRTFPKCRILKNWPERYVNLIVVSDGERMGSIGDVGVHAIRSPISKLSMYTGACVRVRACQWCRKALRRYFRGIVWRGGAGPRFCAKRCENRPISHFS